MSISFKEIVESVLLLEANYSDINAALTDRNSWLYKVSEKLISASIVDAGDFQKEFTQAFGSITQARRFSKNSVDEDLITIQDLIYSLYWNVLINTKSTDRFPLIDATATDGDFINNTQKQYESTGSIAQTTIENWLNPSNRLTPTDSYVFINTPVRKAYRDFKKERDILQQAAYETYKTEAVLPALYKIIEKRVSVTRKILNKLPKKIYNSNYNALVKSMFIETNKYITGENDGINVFKKGKNISGTILNALKYMLGRVRATNYLKNLEEETDGIYVKELLTLSILSKQVFDEVVFTEFVKTNPSVTILSIEPDKSASQDPYIQFLEKGDIQNTTYTINTQNSAGTKLPPKKETLPKLPIYTLGNIEVLNTSTSKQFIEAFKALCLHINKKEGQGREQLSNMLGGLNQAAGVKL